MRTSIVLSTAATSGLLILGLACQDGGTGTDAAPSANIEQVLIEGEAQNTLLVVGRAGDDRGLATALFYIDDQLVKTDQLHGKSATIEAELPDVPYGDHTVSLRIEDTGGNATQDTEQISLPQPNSGYSADVFVIRDDEVVPATGETLCVENAYCGVVDANGRAEIANIPWQRQYRIGFIQSADKSFLVGFGENHERLDNNIINYINTEAPSGGLPLDTAIVLGINRRTLIYADAATVPVKELISTFNGDVFTHFIGEPGMVSKFTFDGNTLEVVLNLSGIDLSQEDADSIIAAAQRGIAWANDRYLSVPNRDPNTYQIQLVVSDTNLPLDWGRVKISPRETAGFSVGPWGFFPVEGAKGVSVVTQATHPWGIRATTRYVEKAIAAVLTSVPSFPDPSFGTFMTKYGSDESILKRQWTARDVQIATIDHLLDNQTQTLPAGGQ